MILTKPALQVVDDRLAASEPVLVIGDHDFDQTPLVFDDATRDLPKMIDQIGLILGHTKLVEWRVVQPQSAFGFEGLAETGVAAHQNHGRACPWRCR